MDEKNFMTAEGLQRLKERLDYLKTEKRQEVAKKIASTKPRAPSKPPLKRKFLSLKPNLNLRKL